MVALLRLPVHLRMPRGDSAGSCVLRIVRGRVGNDCEYHNPEPSSSPSWLGEAVLVFDPFGSVWFCSGVGGIGPIFETPELFDDWFYQNH